MLDSIRFVLSHPQHAGNIGACARALKTMGLSDLRLVNPRDYPSEEANVRACGGLDILQAARVQTSVAEAVADCVLVVGTSARARSLDYEVLDPRQLAERIAREAGGQPVAIVFGRENNGLDNDELSRCHLHVMVPANPDYSSLNIASAVQILAYEMRMAHLAIQQSPAVASVPEQVNAEQMDLFFAHLQQVLLDIEFLKPTASTQLMAKLQRLYRRAPITPVEMNILRGILRATELKIAAGKGEART